MQLRFSAAFGAAVLGAVVLSSCGGGGSNSGGGTTTSTTTTGGAGRGATASAGGGKHLKLAFITNNASDYWTIARKGTEKAQSELPNVSVDFRIPDDGTAAKQTSIVNDLIAAGVDGFAISPVDPANETQLLDQAASQTLVFTQDSDAPQSKRACYVGTDNVAAGRQAGDTIKKALPNGGKIMVFVGKADAQNAKERYEGVQDSLKGSKIQILGELTDDTDRTRAIANVSDTLVKYPDIAASWELWSYNGPAILSAVKNANKVGKVKIICFDEEADTLQGVKSGAIEGTVVQQPFEMGYQSITMMAKYLNGDKSVIPASKEDFIPTQVIRKDNVDAFMKQLAQLTGKPVT